MTIRTEARYAWYSYRQLVAGVAIGAVVAGGGVALLQRGDSDGAYAAQKAAAASLEATPATNGSAAQPTPGPTSAVPPSSPPQKISPSATPDSITISGEAVLLERHWEDAISDVACYDSSVTFVAINGKQETVALAALDEVEPTEVEHSDGGVSWTCTYPYSMDLPADSPVYSFKASVEGVETVEAWTETANTSTLVADPPRPLLSWCSACEYSPY